MGNTAITDQILNHALDCVSKGIMIQDMNRRVVFFNRACEEITRWPKEQVIGKDCGDIFRCHTSTGMCLTDEFCPGMDIFQGKVSSVSRELVVERGDGSECWVETSASAIRDSDGNVTHIVTVVEDISERKRFASEVIRSKTLSTLGTFASELAHEIKNPLNAMNIQMQLMEREIQDVQKISNKSKKGLLEITSIVQKEINRLTVFVDECLRFSKTGELNKNSVDVSEILGEVVSLLLPQAQLSGIQIRLDVVKGLPILNVDKDKVKQAILNILINGLEAMPDGGKLFIKAEQINNELWISCQDTGTGIPNEIKDRIFDLFYTTKNGGTGIGLAFAQNIIQAHGGALKLLPASTGSKFVVVLPI